MVWNILTGIAALIVIAMIAFALIVIAAILIGKDTEHGYCTLIDDKCEWDLDCRECPIAKGMERENKETL